jgi:hypothetical protein
MNHHANFGVSGTYHARSEGSKGQRIILANINARSTKFGQNVYFYSGKTNPSLTTTKNLKNDVFGG